MTALVLPFDDIRGCAFKAGGGCILGCAGAQTGRAPAPKFGGYFGRSSVFTLMPSSFHFPSESKVFTV